MSSPGKKETELVFALINGTEESESKIQGVANKNPDWQQILSLATHHSLLPHLYKAINDCNSAPDEFLSALESQYQELSLRNLQSTNQLHELLDVFRENGVRALPYKGPTLSQFAYGDINRRQYSDLDFLVVQNDLERARDILQQNSYTQLNACGVPLEELAEDSCFRWEGELKFEREDNFLVELRPQLTGNGASNVEIIHDFWQRRTSLSVGGKSQPALSSEDRAMLLLVHGSKHGWCRLSWIADIIKLLERDISWKTVLRRAEEYNWRIAVLFGLATVAELADVTLPQNVYSEIESCYRPNLGAKMTSVLYQIDPTGSHLDLEPWTVVFFLNDTAGGVLSEFIDVLISPRLVDHEWIALPPRLYPLYYIIRPINFGPRLIKSVRRNEEQ